LVHDRPASTIVLLLRHCRAAEQSDGGKTVGVDPTVITAGKIVLLDERWEPIDRFLVDARKLSEKIKKKGGSSLKPIAENLVDLVWGSDKPERPQEKVRVLDVKFAGKKFQEKLEDLRKELDKKKSQGMIVSMLDETAWLFNLRGNDIPYNPVFFSYAIVTPTDATLFIDDTKLSADVHAHLGEDVKVKPYKAIFEEMTALKASFETATADGKSGPKQKFLISTKASWALSEGLGGEENVDEVRSPIGDAKAIKNETELEGMRQCHIRDGAALIEYFAWLEDQLVNKGAKLDEVETSDKLEEMRS
jgi:Xaa-Pro aminopeptidase